MIYPPENRDLFRVIPTHGALLSEYPLGTKPDSFRFPARNRIISGLSRGVVVVEATNKSGSLITADLALEQGREVFAVPGQADSLKSAGCHRLLRDGARLVTSVADIVDEFSVNPEAWQEAERAEPEGIEVEEQTVLAALEHYPRSIDEVIVDCGMPAEKVSELLLLLEIKGYCEVLPGQLYRSKEAAP
jgi:DNA processing protein